jgi:type VI secretion system secreted protein Hcp
MKDMFWEIDGITGESTSSHGKAKAGPMIDILSFNHGVSMPLSNDPAGISKASGKCVHKDFTITKHVDISSPMLNVNCSGGQSIKEMKIHLWKADNPLSPMEYLTYSFTSCILTSVDVGGGGAQPIETVKFTYTTITWDYMKQKPSAKGGKEGKSSAFFDLSKSSTKA